MYIVVKYVKLYYKLYERSKSGVNSLVNICLILFTSAGLLIALYLFFAQRADEQALAATRQTEIYQRLCRRLDKLDRHYIGQILVEQTGVIVRTAFPEHVALHLFYIKEGVPMRNPAFARNIATLLQRDYALLAQKDYYRLRRYRVYRMNGMKEYGYSFTMTFGFKQAAYDKQRMYNLRIY